MSSTIDPSQWFERIVYALVMHEDDPAEVVAMDQHTAVLRYPRTGSRVLLLRYLPERDPAVAARLDDIGQLAHDTPLQVALIGGPPGAQKLLEDSKPRSTRQWVWLYHLRDDGTLWPDGAHTSRTSPLATELVPPQGAWPPAEDERARFAAKIEQQLAATSREQQEMSSFAAIMQQRRPDATCALAAVIAVVFALQLLWGATESDTALVCMGALVPGLIRDGEWWRLVSSSFLHSSLLHLLENMLALLILGNVLERVLGTSRFLVLYGASALAGSLASFLAGDYLISVGASDALWGLLIADAVLAFRPRGLLPAAMIQKAKRTALTILVFAILSSFGPEIDMAAHFGGGAMGLLLLGTGALTVGLRPLVVAGPPSEDGAGPAPAQARPGMAHAFTAGAVLVVLVLAAGLALGLIRGRAWALGQPPELERREVPELGLTALIPPELAPRDVAPYPGVTRAIFGDFPEDPVAVYLLGKPFSEPLSAEQFGAVLARQAMKMAKSPREEYRVALAPEFFHVRGEIALRAVYELPNGTRLEHAVVLEPTHLVRVDVLFLAAYRAEYDGLATRVLESLQPLTPP